MSFPFVAIPELQPVVLEVLRRHPDLPPETAEWLSEHPDILQLCAIEVKRQVWQLKAETLQSHLQPLLDAYLANPAIQASARDYHRGVADSAAMVSKARSAGSRRPPSHALETGTDPAWTRGASAACRACRRQHPIVQQLLLTVGTSLPLYSKLLRTLRSRFVYSGNRLLCALRADILMAFHDANVTDVRPDPTAARRETPGP